MKKLSKIRLHNAIVMNDREMKSVVGGFVTGGEDSGVVVGSSCEGQSESDDLVCNGTCPPAWNGPNPVQQSCSKSSMPATGKLPKIYFCYCS